MKKVVVIALLLSGCGWLPPFYGTSSTTTALRQDVVALLKEDLAQQYNCRTLGVIDSVVQHKTAAQVVEGWTVQACGRTHRYDVVLTPGVVITPATKNKPAVLGTGIDLVDRDRR